MMDLRQQKIGTFSAIPRRKGDFLLAPIRDLQKTGGSHEVFVGMFDEVNEGTAIYKVANQTPVGKHFVTYEGLPNDWYLWLTGQATRMIHNEAPFSEHIPENLLMPKG